MSATVLTYNTIQSAFQERFLPYLPDLVFRDHYLLARLYDKKKLYNDEYINQSVEYGSSDTAKFVSEWGTYSITKKELLTKARFQPKQLVDSFVISFKEADQIKGNPNAIHNTLTLGLENVRKSLKKKLAQRLWSRDVTGTDDWSSLQDMVSVSACGGIPASGDVPVWWKSKVIDVATDTVLGGGDKGGDPTSESDLEDPNSGVYIFRVMNALKRRCRLLNNEDPKLFLTTPYIYDIIQGILESKKILKMSEKAYSYGFSAIDWGGVEIMSDPDATDAQEGDTDGLIYALNDDYIYMYFNSNEVFAEGEFQRIQGMLAMEKPIYAMGNIAISNRAVQGVATGIYSPQE